LLVNYSVHPSDYKHHKAKQIITLTLTSITVDYTINTNFVNTNQQHSQTISLLDPVDQ